MARKKLTDAEKIQRRIQRLERDNGLTPSPAADNPIQPEKTANSAPPGGQITGLGLDLTNERWQPVDVPDGGFFDVLMAHTRLITPVFLRCADGRQLLSTFRPETNLD